MQRREEAPTMGRPREAQRGKHRPTDRQKDTGRLRDREEEKRDRDKARCSWRQNYGDTDRDIGETQRQGDTVINPSANFLKCPLCARHCSRC